MNKNKYRELEVKSKKIMVETLLSPYSRIFYNEWKLDQNRSDYNIVFDQSLEGEINIQTLNKAIKRFVNDYIIFNSHIEDKNGKIYWVKNYQIYGVEYFKNKLSNNDILKYILKPFNLESGPLYRFGLIKVDNSKYRFVIVLHHIIISGRSFNYFCNKLSSYYNDQYYKSSISSIEEQLIKISNLSNDLSKYVELKKEQSKFFWKEKLADIEPIDLTFLGLTNNQKKLLTTSCKKLELSIQELSGIGEIRFSFDKKILSKLNKLKGKYRITPYVYGQAICAVLLHRYSGQDRLCISYPIVITEGIDFIHGAQVNTNIFTFDFSKINNILDIIEQSNEFIISLRDDSVRHSYLPIYDIVSASNSYLLSLAFVQTDLKDKALDLENIKVTINNTDIGLSNDFVFEHEIQNEKINYIVRYKLDKIDTALLNEFISCYKRLFIETLDELVELEDINQLNYIKNYELLTQEQYKQIIYTWNDTSKDYPSDKTIHKLFEEQVEKTPDSIAVVYENSKLTYRELNTRSNQLANYLRVIKDIKPDTLIALCLDRSEHMLIAILSVLKVGGAYVPVDPSYPDERIKYILEDTNTKLVLTNEVYKQRLEDISKASVANLGTIEENLQIRTLAIDNKEIQEQLSLQLVTNLDTETTSSNLAYVIYTSGTTGNPKGVMIEHKGVVNRIQWMSSMYPLRKSDKILQKTPYVFDVSIWELLWASWYGACLIFAKREGHKDANYIIDLMNKESVTVTHFVPSMLSVFNNTIKANIAQKDLNIDNPIPSLRYIFCSGEVLNLAQAQQCSNMLPNIELNNLYGPTEASIDVLYYDCTNSIKTVYIGKQIDNTSAYVLNNNLNPLPIGAIGELYIGGVGLARGYLNRAELTAERFIVNPFQSKEERLQNKNTRLYKTGDLVRWLPDGNLEYIGRNDFQVKIRGYRIELGEIEGVLSSYEGIKQSVVLAKEHKDMVAEATSNKYLVGYYVSETRLNEEEILSYLQSRLPEYMVPSLLTYLESLPLTINGKLDREALPCPEFTSGDRYIVPRNDLEVKVCQILAEVLQLAEDKVGIRDNFFKLGGDSIVSIRLVSRLRQRLGLNVSVKDIFNYKNIERLYDNVLNKASSNTKLSLKTEQGMLSGEVLLLPIQEWFFGSNFTIAYHWNQSFIIKTPDLDLNKLCISISKLVEHHDSFRLRYKKSKDSMIKLGGVVSNIQYYDSNAKIEELKTLDIRTLTAKEGSKGFETELQSILTNWQNGFNLEVSPIYSIGYIYGYADGSSRIYFALHHLIVDAVSWRILVEDLKDLYNQKDLGPKGSSYRQWVNTVKEYANAHESEKDYWVKLMSDYNINQLNKLVVDEDTRSYASLILSLEQTKQLLYKSNQAYNTQVNDILLTALGYALFEVTNSKVNHIVLEGHGREEIDSSIDITRTVGWFTTMYPVRLEVSGDLGISLKNIKESLRQVPNKGIGYGALIGYKPSNLPRISFNYLGQFDKEDNTQLLQTESAWCVIEEISGISVDPANKDYNIININGLVIGGRLRFNIASKLDKKNTTKIAELFKQRLEDIISHTVKQTRSFLTVSDVDNIISQEYLDKLQGIKEIEAVYFANSLQQGFIYHALNQGDIDDSYKVQLILQYNTQLEVSKLQEAWHYAQKKFSSLRLRLAWEEELVQVIDKRGSLDWRYIDLSNERDTITQEVKIKRVQEEDRLEPYKLEQGNLFRIYVIKQEEELYTCIFSQHHAILDGWSNPILLGYIHEIYLKLQEKASIPLSIDRSYEDSQRYLQKHESDNKDYWYNYISQIEERSDLSGLLSITNKDKHLRISQYNHITDPEEQLLTIKDNLYYSLKNLGQEEGITLNAILQYVWHKALSIYGNTNQTVVGTIVSGRNLPINDIESSVGLYINTLPLIVDHRSQTTKSIIESIKAIQSDINEINGRSEISLARLQKGGERLFDSLFMYENYPNPIKEEQQNRLKIDFKGGIEKQEYPLGVIAYEENNQLMFKLKYAGELFSNYSIKRLLLIIKRILEQIANNPNQQVQNLSYLNEEQHKQIIYTWNNTDKDYPSDKTIHKLFEEQVEKTPDSIAVVYEDESLTYRELNERTNQLGYYLRELGVEPDTLVAIVVERSLEMIIGLLGILKAGGAYVPLDSNYPAEYLQFILEDIQTPIILTDKKTNDKIPATFARVISLDEEWDYINKYSSENLISCTSSYNLAYVIYTSGTTGKPKGVMIEHKGVVNLKYDLTARYKLGNRNNNEVILQFANYVFDASVEQIILSLLNGYVLVLIPNQLWLNKNEFYYYLNINKVTHIHATPTFLDQYDFAKVLSLKRLIFGGEQLNENCYNKIVLGKSKIINEYGPTETSITSIVNVIQDNNLSIGVPISNTRCYVLDTNLTPLPIEAIGELYIGGVGLARGYLNRDKLTEERFIANPFQTKEEKRLDKNAKLYKTGDLVCWLSDGNLKYIGRNDFQVKIRGYRIELGEIEVALSSYLGVKQSVVLAKENKRNIDGVSTDNKYLVGYYVSETKLDQESIINYLQSRLPEYMIPSILVHLDNLPLTINGKLDRKALPEPEFTSSDSYVAPRNELERELCQIWTEILGLSIDKVGIHDDFFGLGGDSIIAIRLVSKINKELDSKISVPNIFNFRTIDKLLECFRCKALDSISDNNKKWVF